MPTTPSPILGAGRYSPFGGTRSVTLSEALREYVACQTREGRVVCRRVDGEVKKFLR